jgi:hypothetical protein
LLIQKTDQLAGANQVQSSPEAQCWKFRHNDINYTLINVATVDLGASELLLYLTLDFVEVLLASATESDIL